MIDLRTLGTLEVVGADGAPVDSVLAQPKRAALLVFLAVGAPSGYVRRDLLVGLLWQDQSERRARGALRQALYAVKQHLGNDVIEARGDEEVRITPDLVRCDVRLFDSAIHAGQLKSAAALYRGPFLGGFYLKGHAQFNEWAEGERDRLSSAYGKALETLVERAAERHEWDVAVDWCRRLARHNPYSTRVVLKYMEAMAAAGDRAGALRYAQRHAARMREELDAAPSPDVEALAARLRVEPHRRDTNP